MLVLRAFSDASATTHEVPGYDKVRRTDYFLADELHGGPTAFLVEQPPHSEIRPHFHPVDQFQVIVEGSGKLGRQSVRPVTAHFAGAHTGYGPITAEEHGLSYLTLRPPCGLSRQEQAARFLPEMKAQQRERRKAPRHATGQVRPGEVPVRRHAIKPVLPPALDGLRADLIELPSGERWHGWDDGFAGGCYLFVVAGRGATAEREFAHWSCAYFSPATDPGPFVAKDEGLVLLSLRFPVDESAPLAS